MSPGTLVCLLTPACSGAQQAHRQGGTPALQVSTRLSTDTNRMLYAASHTHQRQPMIANNHCKHMLQKDTTIATTWRHALAQPALLSNTALPRLPSNRAS